MPAIKQRKKNAASPISSSAKAPSAQSLRALLQVNQEAFARLLSASTRSVASLEGGITPSSPVSRRLNELARLFSALAEVMQAKAIGAWLQAENPAFEGFKPIEVIERGEVDRVWSMIYFLRSGVPA